MPSEIDVHFEPSSGLKLMHIPYRNANSCSKKSSQHKSDHLLMAPGFQREPVLFV